VPTLDVRRFSPALTKGFLGLALLTTAVAFCVHLASYGPDQIGPSLINVAIGLFPVMFVVFGPAVVVISLARIPFERIFASLPVYLYVLGGAVLLYVFVDFFLMMQLLPGQPVQVGPNFYFDNGGALTPISAESYRIALMHATRLFSGHELIFFALGTLIAYQIDRIRLGRISLDVSPRDEAIERSPLPYPLARIVGLQTNLAPETCAARLLTPQPRAAWSLFGASNGLRGEASAVGFRVEMAGSRSQLAYAFGRVRAVGGETWIRVLTTFKRWPLIVLLVSILLAPVVWAIMGGLGFPLPGFWLLVVLIFGVGGNFLFGLDQRRRLLKQIKRTLEARETPPGDPNIALMS